MRTATVLFTDLVGSTGLFSRVGAEAADRLRVRHFTVLQGSIRVHCGQLVKNTGDGVMVAFESATDAVRCAVEMQRGIDEDNRRRRRDPMMIRVGISMGEALIEDGDYFGHPVVEASRLCAAAQPGEILTTETVRMLVGSRSGYALEPVGALELKGLPEPVQTSRIWWEPERQDRVRVVLADDAVLVREGVARLLEEEGIEVVAQASDAEELHRCVHEVRPHLAITDVRMPPTNQLEGLEAAERIRAELPGTAVLLLSQHLESRYALRLTARGARGVGYVLKERVTDVTEFAQIVRTVAAGGAAIDRDVVDGLLRRSRAGSTASWDDEERALLGLIASGLADEGIAAATARPVPEVAAAVETLLTRVGIEAPAHDDRVAAALAYLAGGTNGAEAAT